MSVDDSIKIISRGTAEIISIDGLKKKLQQSEKNKKPLIIKAGFDPTAPDIHLGHVVLLRKLKHFQDLGHQVLLLIGDFTGQIGDPSGCDQTRRKLSRKIIDENAKTYKKQIFKILNPKKTKVVFNSKWLDRLSSQGILELTTHVTVAQMLARADFKKRMSEKKEISILEFMYPLLQGYDSVKMGADIELGGTDQKFNLLMGRQMQEIFDQDPQVVIMTPLLEGTDGVQKMSKSLDNYIGINESPDEIFGKIMSITDELMLKYYECLTDCNLLETKGLHPKEAKLQLAHNIVAQFYDKKKADQACTDFERVFSQRQVPEDITEYTLKEGADHCLIDVLLELKLVSSKKEVRRLLEQGAISYEGEKILDEGWMLKKGVIKIGKRRFLKLV